MEGPVALYLTEKKTSKRIDMSPSALRKWRRQGFGPPYIKIGRLIRYPVVELDNWLLANLKKQSL